MIRLKAKEILQRKFEETKVLTVHTIYIRFCFLHGNHTMVKLI